jgi:hypothetical protein
MAITSPRSRREFTLKTPNFHESPQRKAMQRLLAQGNIPGLYKFGAGSPDEASFPKDVIGRLDEKIRKIPGVFIMVLMQGLGHNRCSTQHFISKEKQTSTRCWSRKYCHYSWIPTRFIYYWANVSQKRQ